MAAIEAHLPALAKPAGRFSMHADEYAALETGRLTVPPLIGMNLI
jgi:hypothetical protein